LKSQSNLQTIRKRCIFHQRFCKAAVGEVRWKKWAESSEGHVGNDTTEAFALLLFANNHKALLCDKKLAHGAAPCTTHACDGNKKDSIVNVLLAAEQEFVLEEEADLEGLLVVCDITKPAHNAAVRGRKEWLAEFQCRPVCRKMVRTWGQTARATKTNDENVANEQQEPPNKKERGKKKRKMMKDFKKWMGTADEGEQKFKGWLDNGHKAFMWHTTDVKKDVVASGKHHL
jgi:hypothetical protein